ncbi:MAG: SulP family inorganic anion transporter [Kofleriaceae bacterium]|nr:SulP family inorganic anion transporter [Kofleriaceae bacterium]
MTTPRSSRREALARDAIAGVVVFLVALPLCLGIALASGAPAIAGLVSGIIGGIVVGSLSGSHVSVSGPAAGLAAIVLTQIANLGSFAAFLLAVMLAGVLQLGFGLLRAGALSKFFPTAVIKGLLAAIGILLILKQLPHLVGYDADYEGDTSFAQLDGHNTFSALLAAARALLPGAAIVGVTCLAILIVWDKSGLKKTIVPGPLVAVLAGTGLSEILAAAGSTWAITPSHLVSVPVVGHNGVGWDDLLHAPDFSQILEPGIYVAAVTLAVVASLETLLNLEATDKLDPLRRVSPPNRELCAQGVGNVLAGLVGGLPMTSVIVRSSVNAHAGSRSRMSAVFHGVLLLIAVLLLPTAINRIPLSALAAVLIVTGFKLASPAVFKTMWAHGKAQFVPFVVTIVAIVTTDLLKGVVVGIVVSASIILWNHRRNGLRTIREQHVGGMITRLELVGQTTFLNQAALRAALDALQPGEHVLIDARMSDYIDADILSVIDEYTKEVLPARDVHVSLLGFKDRHPIGDRIEYVDVSTREVQQALTPARVLQHLKEGNERFVTGQRLHRDLVRQVDATAKGQHPMAAVLSCIDSRAPAELVFDLGIGDIFSCRLAGNVGSRKALGSLEFACKVAGAKLVLVLGHTQCGAVKAACELEELHLDAETATGLTNLGGITQTIAESVRIELAHTDGGARSGPEFVDRVAEINVRHTMRWIQEHSPVLSAMIVAGEIALVGAMYDVATGRVTFLDAAAVIHPPPASKPAPVVPANGLTS